MHKWITDLKPGHVELGWDVDDAYLNLEGAVICSWTAALADQALFFAANSLCAEGESTRMMQLQLTYVRNITAGPVRITAHVDDRVDGTFYATCQFHQPDGRLAARITAVIGVVSGGAGPSTPTPGLR